MPRREAPPSVDLRAFVQHPDQTLHEAEDHVVEVVNRRRAVAYLVPGRAYEAMVDRLEDLEEAERGRREDAPPPPGPA